MNQNIFTKSKIALSVSLILSGVTLPAYSAENVEKEVIKEEVEVIQITGQRGNLISAQNMKMNADTVLDAISSEDMGSMPDRSVLEAISRLPGVAIERFAAANDPDHFGVEGGGVVVRGLTHVRSEFNHRDTFSADSGRGLSFEDVSPELMGSVEVYKNQTADMIEGGIAGSVNLNTRKAFDADGRGFAFTLDSTYTDLREETSPRFSLLYSDIFETDVGRFGFLANYSNSELKVRSDGVQAGLYTPQARDENIYVPRSTRLSKKEDDRNREGIALSLQCENPSKTTVITGEYIRSDASLSWGENVIEMDDGDSNHSLLPV
jgi:TonB-dependent receptor